MHPHALDILLAGNFGHYRGIHLANMNKATLETKLARLLDDESHTTRRRGIDTDDIRILRQHAQQYGVKIRQATLKELFGHGFIAQLLDELGLHLDRPP